MLHRYMLLQVSGMTGLVISYFVIDVVEIRTQLIYKLKYFQIATNLNVIFKLIN